MSGPRKQYVLHRDYWVVKRNALNEMYLGKMSAQEMKLFSVYLSRINKDDERTKKVRFTTSELYAITGKLEEVRMSYYNEILGTLASKGVGTGEPPNRTLLYPIFDELRFDRNKRGDYFIELNPNKKAMPLLFNFKREYFKYRLWNVLNLKSKYHIRLYEILKQYENSMEKMRTVFIDELKQYLCYEEETEYRYFRRDVLDKAQKAIAEHTDITFTYETFKDNHKVLGFDFFIKKNRKYKDTFNDHGLIDVEAEKRKADETPYEEVPEYREEYVHSTRKAIKMTTTEYHELVAEHGEEKIADYMDKMEDWTLSSGKTYANYAAAIRKWIRADEEKRAERLAEGDRPRKRNRFANFKGRERDFEELERLEREHLIKSLS